MNGIRFKKWAWKQISLNSRSFDARFRRAKDGEKKVCDAHGKRRKFRSRNDEYGRNQKPIGTGQTGVCGAHFLSVFANLTVVTEIWDLLFVIIIPLTKTKGGREGDEKSIVKMRSDAMIIEMQFGFVDKTIISAAAAAR